MLRVTCLKALHIRMAAGASEFESDHGRGPRDPSVLVLLVFHSGNYHLGISQVRGSQTLPFRNGLNTRTSNTLSPAFQNTAFLESSLARFELSLRKRKDTNLKKFLKMGSCTGTLRLYRRAHILIKSADAWWASGSKQCSGKACFNLDSKPSDRLILTSPIHLPATLRNSSVFYATTGTQKNIIGYFPVITLFFQVYLVGSAHPKGPAGKSGAPTYAADRDKSLAQSETGPP